MIHLHTHILPGIDDGSKSPEMSLEMLRMQAAQGVDTVVLTPHFYRNREHLDHYLERRRDACIVLGKAIKALPEEEQQTLPQLYLRCEVAWMPNMLDWDELEQLCIGKTNFMLLELPFKPWSDDMIRQIYDLMGKRGIVPIIAHLERYWKDHEPAHLSEILSMGVPIQVSVDPLLHPFQRSLEMKMLKHNQAQFIASDCHNLTTRPPNLGQGTAFIRKKFGDEMVTSMERRKRRILGLDPQV